MSRKKAYLQVIINAYLKDVAYTGRMDIDNNLIESMLSKSQVSEGLDMIDKMINDKSKELLPVLELHYRIENISVGKTNHLKPELLNAPATVLGDFRIDDIAGLEDIVGISWNNETQCLEGEAENAGTFKLEIHGVFKSSKGYEQKTKGVVSLTVIPDPKSLWKTLEPEEDIPYPKPHEDSMLVEAEDGSRLLYASKRGRSHAHVGTYRDDDGEILASKSGWSILVISDGGGSYPLARRGGTNRSG
ncbi:MAG: protein phosphatase 2C domain-containing protein [Sulfurovum sp.]|nr:protein phosphatase 2C domain-containing protein [Sulfurovum sp.]